ncbi:unnamed protein product [Echinostoma caproni]|uniref:SH3 domain-containing protein n=1 Tax=Echinostoma caproni TaxID=27848 RepID=A0A183AKL6_9TREM|nr:unnamed protein product [Echinostoma caproni]
MESRGNRYSSSSDYHSQSSEKTSGDENEDTTSEIVAKEINSEWLNAEGALLNRCFDDVEVNMEQIREKVQKTQMKLSLQVTQFAVSSKKTNRKTSQWGKLIEQTDTDKQFREVAIDFFQKFKFSVILLSRLSDHLKDPKASVLIKQLFVLLNECVGYWRQSAAMSAEFPRTISQPLFPRYTIVFLEANLITDHERLLRELGPAWNRPREDFDPSPVYIPTFKNGFEVNSDDYEPSLFHYDQLEEDKSPEQRYMQEVKLNGFAKELLLKNLRVSKVVSDYQSEKADQFSVSTGEFVEVLEDSGDLHQIRKESGAVGLCPATALTPIEVETM